MRDAGASDADISRIFEVYSKGKGGNAKEAVEALDKLGFSYLSTKDAAKLTAAEQEDLTLANQEVTKNAEILALSNQKTAATYQELS
jgi:hypothetical protein